MKEYVVESLKGCDLEKVSSDTKISRWTLLKIRQRQIKNPGVDSIEPLYHYFKRLEPRRGAV
jgi:hypothetical protein